jgi:hypothetical protein
MSLTLRIAVALALSVATAVFFAPTAAEAAWAAQAERQAPPSATLALRAPEGRLQIRPSAMQRFDTRRNSPAAKVR